MPRSFVKPLERTTFQFLRSFTPPDDQYNVQMAQSVLNANLSNSDTIDDDTLPTTFLGCDTDWTEGTPDDYNVKITKGDYYTVQDLTSASARIYKPAVISWLLSNISRATTGQKELKLPFQDDGGTYDCIVDWGDGTQDTITSYNQSDIYHLYDSLDFGTFENWGIEFTSSSISDQYWTYDAPDGLGGTNEYYVWYSAYFGGTDPGPIGSRTGLKIELGSSKPSISNVVQKTVAFFQDNDYYISAVDSDTSYYLQVVCSNVGAVDDAANVNTNGLSLSTTIQGDAGTAERFYGYFFSGDVNNTYWTFNAPDGIGGINEYYVWYNVGGNGTDPSLSGKTGIEVQLTYPVGQSAVMTSTRDAINTVASGYASASVTLRANNYSVYFTCNYSGNVTNAGAGTLTGNLKHCLDGVSGTVDPIVDVTISGDSEGFGYAYLYYEEDHSKLHDVKKWGEIKLHDWGSQFSYCNNFTDCSGALDLSNLSDITYMFEEDHKFNGDLSEWDLINSDITSLEGVFLYASSFNGDVTTWNTSNITNMIYSFYGASSFNQDIGDWNVSSVTGFYGMFVEASSFNQDISSWDVTGTTSLYLMFQAATSFNQDISSWDVSTITNMSNIFDGATAFNQDLSSWDVSSVANMNYMFQNATSFDQDIGSWDISSLLYASSMFTGVTLSTANYDALLVGWSTLSGGETQIPTGITFSGGNSQYTTTGQTAKNTLTTTYSWIITDGGLET